MDNQPRLVSVNASLASAELGLEVEIRIRQLDGRWLAVADFGGEPEVGIGQRFGQQSATELWGALFLRYHGFPWDKWIVTTLAWRTRARRRASARNRSTASGSSRRSSRTSLSATSRWRPGS